MNWHKYFCLSCEYLFTEVLLYLKNMLCGVWLVFVIWQMSLCLFHVVRRVGVVSSVENCKRFGVK
jgi:hypothetical protein